jgi:hypothetical protein
MHALNCGEFCISTNIQWFIHEAKAWFSEKARTERAERNSKWRAEGKRTETLNCIFIKKAPKTLIEQLAVASA